jgi:hypothetical protein
MTRWLIAGCCCLAVCGVAAADEKAAGKETYLRGSDWNKSFNVLGEYAGSFRTDDGDIKVGVQVYAEGPTSLAWTAYMGGLPGDGWDGNMPIRGTGELQNGVAQLKGETGRGEAKDGSLVVFDMSGKRLGELPRVERVSPTIGRRPPRGALVLFDGLTAENFENGQLSEERLLKQGATSKDKFQSCEVHLEFMTSFMPNSRGQGRSNSGCYLQGRYEVQVLDSFGLSGEDNECGGVYEISRPAVNLCFPPLQWQTYDIEFHAAKFGEDGRKTDDAWMTVKHNGVVVHDKLKLPRATRAAILEEGPEPGPLHLQDHGDEVRYRNIWVMAIED